MGRRDARHEAVPVTGDEEMGLRRLRIGERRHRLASEPKWMISPDATEETGAWRSAFRSPLLLGGRNGNGNGRVDADPAVADALDRAGRRKPLQRVAEALIAHPQRDP